MLAGLGIGTMSGTGGEPPNPQNRWRAFPVTAPASRQWKPARASELVEEVMQSIPTIFGRLVMVAALEDTSSGKYHAPLLAILAGADVVDSVLHSAHADLVLHWLSLGLDRQVDDLLDYLREFDQRGIELSRTVAAMSDYSDLLPGNVRDMYRNHFFMEMKRVAVLAKARLQS